MLPSLLWCLWFEKS